MSEVLFRRGYKVILLSVMLLFLLVSVQLSIPATARANQENTKLSFNAAYGWHDWTVNPDFNEIGGTIGAYWVARTWKWDVTTGQNEPGGPNDIAYFYKSGSDYRLKAKAATPDYLNWIHCAGATQGWVWDSDRPNGLFQPTPLRITSAIGQLKSKTYLVDYSHADYPIWGVLSNIWFKVKNIWHESHYIPSGVLGIDFYYDSNNPTLSDGSFRSTETPTSITMIYTKKPNPPPGIGWTTFDVLQALIEAQQKAQQAGIYFDISNCWLYQAEVLVEEAFSMWVIAKYSYFNVYYFETGTITGLQLSYLITSSEDQKNDIIDIRKTDDFTYSIHKLDATINVDDGFYILTLKTLRNTEAALINVVKLLAVDCSTHNVTEIPVHFAFSQQSMKYVNLQVLYNDKVSFKLSNGDSLELWFDSSEIPYKNYQLFLVIVSKLA